MITPLRTLAAATLVALGALAGTTAVLPAQAAAAASVFDNGWTVLTFDDATVGHVETEGSMAVGGNLTFTRGHALVHTTGLTPTGYDLPRVGGTPVRLLVGERFNAAGSSGVSQVTSAGNVTPDQIGQVRIGDTANLSINPRSSTGLWMSAFGTTSGTQPALETTDRVNQSASSVSAPGAFRDAAGTPAQALATAQAWASCQAHAVSLVQGNDVHERVLNLVTGTNVLTVQAADLESFNIRLAGAALGPDTNLLINVLGAGAVTMPAFSAAASTSANQPNTVAPWVLWNFGDSTSVSLTSEKKVTGSILAPAADLTVSFASPFEGQVVARELHTTGGEFHHYGLRASFECGTDPSSTSTPTSTTSPTSTSTVSSTATTTASSSPSDSPTSTASTPTVPDETESTSTGGVDAEATESPEVAGEQETNDAGPSGDAAAGAELPETGAAGWMTLIGVTALVLLLVGGVVLLSARSRVRQP